MKKDIDLVVLNYAIRNKKFLLEMGREIKPEYFSPNYREFYIALHGAFQNPEIKDILSPDALSQYCDMIKIGGMKSKIIEIYTEAKKVGEQPENDFRFYIKNLKDRYNRVLADQLSQDLKSGLAANIDLKELNKTLSNMAREINTIHLSKSFDEGSLSEDIVNIYKEYTQIAENPTDFRGVVTGFPSLDNLTNGFFPGELIIVAGFEGSGKSLVSMNWALGAWMGTNTIDTAPADYNDSGHNVVYISLEMPRSNKGKASSAANLNKRSVACLGKLPFTEFRRGALPTDALERFKKTCKFVKEYEKLKRFYVTDMPRGVSVEDVEAKIIEIKEKMPIDLLVIDYIGLMKGTEDESDWKALGDIAAGLHELARVYEIPIITPCQVNRPGNQNHSLNNQKYNTTRIARASGISHNANMVFVIESRDNEYSLEDMPMQIVKMRDAEKGEFQFMKDFKHMRIVDPLSTNTLLDQVDDIIGVDTSSDIDDLID